MLYSIAFRHKKRAVLSAPALDKFSALCYNKSTKGNLPVSGMAHRTLLHEVTAILGRSGYFFLCPAIAYISDVYEIKIRTNWNSSFHVT